MTAGLSYLILYPQAKQTAFLGKFDAELLIGYLSYKQKADIYHKYEKVQKKKPEKLSISQDRQSNGLSDDDEEDDTSISDLRYSNPLTHVHLQRNLCSSQSLCERACLDRRRLEEAHLRYAILCIYQRYEGHFTTWSLSSCIKETLQDITPTYYEAFSAHYMCKC